MAKLMRTVGRSPDAGTCEVLLNQGCDAPRTAKAADGCVGPQEDAPAVALRPPAPQVLSNCRAHVRGQGEDTALAFPLNAQGSVIPVNVFQFESHHFARSQSQSSKQKQNRVVAASYRGASIDGGQQPTPGIRRNCAGDRRHRPVGDSRNSGGQITPDLSETASVVQERSQRGCQEFG